MIRVIGLGSPFGDDQAGWWVIEQMRSRIPPQVDLVRLDRPGASLVNWMEGVTHLYIIDAIVGEGLPAGRIVPLETAQLDGQSRLLTSHQLALAETLHLAEALECRPARVDILGIAICDITSSSVAVEAAANRAAKTLADDICAEIDAVPATRRGTGCPSNRT